MLKKWNSTFIVLFLLTTLIEPGGFAAQAINPFQGTWLNDNGHVYITNCTTKKCRIEIFTSNGAHTCEVDEQLTVLSNNKAVFNQSDSFIDSKNKKRFAPINLSLAKHVITIIIPPGSSATERYSCGLQGFFEGEYTNIITPRIYKTSYNCDKAKTNIEVAICQSKNLALSDKILAKLYNQLRAKQFNILKEQKEWLHDRDTCNVSTHLKSCLTKKYRNRILDLQADLMSNAVSPSPSGQNDSIPYNFDYLYSLTKDPDFDVFDVYEDPPLLYYLNVFLPKKTIKEILPMNFHAIATAYADDSLIMIRGGAPGFYTIYEGALVLTKDHQTWLAYTEINEASYKQMFVLCPIKVPCDAPPKPLKKWINTLLPEMDIQDITYSQILPDTMEKTA